VERVFLRIADPIELWDGTKKADECALALAGEEDWSLFLVSPELQPPEILAAYYGNRRGYGPVCAGYLLIPESVLLMTNGGLHQSAAMFDWPPEVRDAHYSLRAHNLAGCKRFYKRKNKTDEVSLLEISRVPLYAEMSRLASRPGADPAYQASVERRVEKLRNSSPSDVEALQSLLQ
jgi:hypothetical protein